MDRRWQLVLDCLDTEQAPFSKGTLIAFRQRLIEANLDRRLIERTIEVAEQAGVFGASRRYARPWIAAPCGERVASRTRITYWVTPYGRRWA